jgi:serine/threonine-protein kinase
MKKGTEYFQQAIETDPSYAAAYSGLAESLLSRCFWGFLSPKETIPKAKALAEKSLEIDDSLAEAHTTLGFIHMVYDWDWKNTEKRIKLALKLNPGYALAYHRYCTYLTAQKKRDEAIAAMRKAVDLDPLSAIRNSELAVYYLWNDRWEESMDQLQKTLEIDPNFGHAYWDKGLIFGFKRKFKEAVLALEKAVQMTGGSAAISGMLGYYCAKSGEKAKAKTLIQRLEDRSKKHYVSSTYTSIGLIYKGLGDNDKCLEYLEKAYQMRDLNLAFLHVIHETRPLISDHRFQDIFKRMGIDLRIKDSKGE